MRSDKTKSRHYLTVAVFTALLMSCSPPIFIGTGTAKAASQQENYSKAKQLKKRDKVEARRQSRRVTQEARAAETGSPKPPVAREPVWSSPWPEQDRTLRGM